MRPTRRRVLAAASILLLGCLVLLTFNSSPFMSKQGTDKVAALVCKEDSAKEEEEYTVITYEYTVITYRGLPYRFPPDLVPFQQNWTNVSVPYNSSIDEEEQIYETFITRMGVECRHRVRMGTFYDGEWDACMVPPFNLEKGCLVYSFGIGHSWSFDDAISKNYGCHVDVFDPTIRKKEHFRSELIHFYPIGLSGSNQVMNNKTYQTLSTIINNLGDSNKTIDYLKIDIEAHEWDSLTTVLNENVLARQVKQFGLEVHSRLGRKNHGFQRFVNLLAKLENIGFRKWHHHVNHACTYKSESPTRSKFYSHCHEIYFININFL